MAILNGSHNKFHTNHKHNHLKRNKHQHHQFKGRTGRRTKEMVAIAKERIRILMRLAEFESVHKGNIERSRRYIELARNLGTRYNVKMEKYIRHKFCRTCNTFLGISSTVRIRNRKGKMIITCKHCGRIRRLPIDKK
jgi:ribonuclease P protein subunit RPR2